MKKPLLVIVLCLFAFMAKAQVDSSLDKELSGPMKPDPNIIYNAVENPPQFPGGMKKFDEYISANTKYKSDARVIAQFIIERDGSLTNITIYRGANDEADAECIRLLKNCPKWIAGRQNNNPVRVIYLAAVKFYSN